MQSKNRQNAPIEPFVRRHRPFFVALFVLIPALAVPALFVFTAVKSDIFQKWHTLHVVYDNSQGLKKGNQVSMSGTAVGYVKDIDLVQEGEVHVMFNVNSRYAHLIKQDTKARLKQRGFVGDWEIELHGGAAASLKVENGDTLVSEKLPSIDKIIEVVVSVTDTAVALLSDIAALVKGIEAGEGTVGQIIKNDTLFRLINRIGTNAVGLTLDARKIAADARGAIADARGAVHNADSMLAAFTGVGKDMGASGTALVDTLMTLIKSVNRSLDDVGHILKNAKTVSDDAPELMIRLQRDLGDAEQMLRSLQEGWLFRSIGGEAPKNPNLADTP